MPNHKTADLALLALADDMHSLKAQVLKEAEPWLERLGQTNADPEHPPIRLDQPDRKAAAPAFDAGAISDRADVAIRGTSALADGMIRNLAHYLAIRHQDLRPIQRRLMPFGLSSLGRLESRVIPTLDAVLSALNAMTGKELGVAAPSTEAFFHGEAALNTATERLFGAAPESRRCRIMVTMPGEAASDAGFMVDLAKRGMDVVRINCAHDSHDVWRALATHAKTAANIVGRPIRVLMDIAGPKIRIEAVDVFGPKKSHDKDKLVMQEGSLLRLIASGDPKADVNVPFAASVSLPQMVTRLRVGDRVRYDDGKIEAVVEQVRVGEALVRVQHAKAGGVKLKAEKGVNLPDTALGLSPLTSKDRADLSSVVELADMVGYSFVSEADDIDLLGEALAGLGRDRATLGLVAKIEKPEAVINLPELIARAVRHHPFGVMIARGDLAAEIGFERLAEIQEEILWICEAAGVPAIWATQVLEGLVRDGIPSRGEMTDAAMAARAECVMLNKGPAVGQAIDVLDRLLSRMDQNMQKKTPQLRALKSWG